MSKIYFNNHIYPGDTPILKVTNSAFLYGQSVFTSTAIIDGHVLFWSEHLKRTLRGVKELFGVEQKEADFLIAEVKSAKKEIVSHLDDENYFRLTFFWQDGLRFLIYIGKQNHSKSPLRTKIVAKELRGEFIPSWIKVGSYINENYLKKKMDGSKFNDVLFVDKNKKILELSTGNIFLGSANLLVTPPENGIFAGIIRKKILEVESEIKFSIQEKVISLEDLDKYDFAFATNSVGSIRPIIKINEHDFNLNFEMIERLHFALLQRSQKENHE